MKNRWHIAVFFVLLSSLSFSTSADEKRYDVPIGDSPQLGPANAPITIIEFLDFQ